MSKNERERGTLRTRESERRRFNRQIEWRGEETEREKEKMWVDITYIIVVRNDCSPHTVRCLFTSCRRMQCLGSFIY